MKKSRADRIDRILKANFQSFVFCGNDWTHNACLTKGSVAEAAGLIKILQLWDDSRMVSWIKEDQIQELLEKNATLISRVEELEERLDRSVPMDADAMDE